MKVYKWNSLINQAVCIVGSLGADCWTTNCIAITALFQTIEQMITKEQIKSWRENAREITKKAQSICENWDVRCATKLFEIFPQLIAKKYCGRPCVVGYDERGNWIVVFEDNS